MIGCSAYLAAGISNHTCQGIIRETSIGTSKLWPHSSYCADIFGHTVPTEQTLVHTVPTKRTHVHTVPTERTHVHTVPTERTHVHIVLGHIFL